MNAAELRTIIDAYTGDQNYQLAHKRLFRSSAMQHLLAFYKHRVNLDDLRDHVCMAWRSMDCGGGWDRIVPVQ